MTQISVGQTKPKTLVLFDKVTNQPVSNAVVNATNVSSDEPSIVDQSSSGSLVNFIGKQAGSANMNISANVTYVNSLGVSVTETKNLSEPVTVGTPNETELRLQ